MLVKEILKSMNIDINKISDISQFNNIEDNSSYDVWKFSIDNEFYVLKKAKGSEINIYKNLLAQLECGVPKLYNIVNYNNEDYILMEYINGTDLSNCTLSNLIKVIDSLIYIQDYYWNNTTHKQFGYTFEESLKSRTNRGKYLNDTELEKYYNIFLNIYSNVPKTLCHDDLLPFNVIVNDDKAVIIDWEIAGILPYPVSLARLIAHSGEYDEFFYMKNNDKEFIINYYYDNFIKDKNINYNEYIKTLNYFILYEYCEWIMLKNKYNSTDNSRYNLYFNKAKSLIKTL